MAKTPQTMNDDAKPDAEMQGGARVETVTVEAPEGEPVADGIEAITTMPGTLGDRGIIAVGTAITVSDETYSDRWMRPANPKAAKRAADVMAKRRGEA